MTTSFATETSRDNVATEVSTENYATEASTDNHKQTKAYMKRSRARVPIGGQSVPLQISL